MSVKIDQAFVKEFIDSGFGLEIAHENIAYTPDGDEPFAELIMLPNDITPYTQNDSNHTDGVFRIILNYPVDTGAIQAKLKADEILSAFSIGTRLNYSGQKVNITGASRYVGEPLNGWYRLVLSVNYYAIIAR